MPTEDELLEEQEDDTPTIKLLRSQLKESKGAAKANAAAQRELAFLKAGVDTSTKAGALLLKAYDGDLSDIEALQNEAKELGALRGEQAAPGATGTPQSESTTTVSTGSQARQEVSGGEPLDPNQKKPIEQVAKEAYDAAIKAQRSDEDALSSWFGAKVGYVAEELGLKPGA